MKHKIKGTTTFGKRKSHRKSMIYNITAELIKNKRIQTTHKRAKAVSQISDRLITLGKKNTVYARRLAYKILKDRGLVKKLFDEIAVNFSNRNGGYTRVIKIGYRRGDAAPISVLEFVEIEKDKKSPSSKKKRKK